MKKLSYVLWALLLAAVLVGAYVAYDFLAEKQQLQPPVLAEPEAETEEASPEIVYAPDFQVYDPEGNAVRLSDFFGKPIVINFWATWCGPCKSELPAFDAVAKKYAEEAEFLMVNLTDGYQEKKADVLAFLEETGYSFPVYYDTDQSAAMTYAPQSIPMTVLIYADGSAAGYWMGAVSEETLEHYVNLLIKGDVHEDQTESG